MPFASDMISFIKKTDHTEKVANVARKLLEDHHTELIAVKTPDGREFTKTIPFEPSEQVRKAFFDGENGNFLWSVMPSAVVNIAVWEMPNTGINERFLPAMTETGVALLCVDGELEIKVGCIEGKSLRDPTTTMKLAPGEMFVITYGKYDTYFVVMHSTNAKSKRSLVHLIGSPESERKWRTAQNEKFRAGEEEKKVKKIKTEV